MVSVRCVPSGRGPNADAALTALTRRSLTRPWHVLLPAWQASTNGRAWRGRARRRSACGTWRAVGGVAARARWAWPPLLLRSTSTWRIPPGRGDVDAGRPPAPAPPPPPRHARAFLCAAIPHPPVCARQRHPLLRRHHLPSTVPDATLYDRQCGALRAAVIAGGRSPCTGRSVLSRRRLR